MVHRYHFYELYCTFILAAFSSMIVMYTCIDIHINPL